MDLDDEHAGCIGCDPVLVKIVSMFLNDPVVAFDVEAGAVDRLEVWIGRLYPKAAEIAREVPLKNTPRLAGFRVVIETLRQEHVGAQVGGPAPKL